MRVELKHLQQQAGLTIIFVTHDQEEAMSLSDRIVVMHQGQIEQVGRPADIYDNPASRFVAEFIGEMNFITRQGKSLGVRPEDVIINDHPSEPGARISSLMPPAPNQATPLTASAAMQPQNLLFERK